MIDVFADNDDTDIEVLENNYCQPTDRYIGQWRSKHVYCVLLLINIDFIVCYYRCIILVVMFS